MTKLTFGTTDTADLTAGETIKVTMLNVGLPGKDGLPAEVDNFTTDPVAYYILSKN